jgi:hypothetical protein
LADTQHVLGHVDGDDLNRRMLQAQGDRDLGGAGADVEDVLQRGRPLTPGPSPPVGRGEKIGDEQLMTCEWSIVS